VEKPKVKKTAASSTTDRAKRLNKPSENPAPASPASQASSKQGQIKFLKHLKSQNLAEGEPLVLEIQVASQSPVDLVWLRNGKEIPENPDFVRERIDNLFKLTVKEIYPEDSGVFSGELISQTTNQTLLTSCSVVVKGRI
jgi:hypothetical protein